MANKNTYNMASVLLIIAAFIGILSFFCGWFVCGESSFKAVVTGSDMLNNEMSGYFGGNAFVPLYILVLSAITAIVAFLPKMGVNIPAPRYSVILIVLGLAILVLTIVYCSGHYTPDDLVITEVSGANGLKFAGAGVWFSIASGVLTILIGALPALTRKV